MYSRHFKRPLDLLCALTGLVILSPIWLSVTLAIIIFDPGPVLFRQERIGLNGRPFMFYKFRTMPIGTPNMPSDRLGTIKLPRISRFLRRTNLDELPQLLNIIKGDMSLVGPRPPVPAQRGLIESRKTSGALACRPGLTGLAQINSFDGMTVSQKAEFDARYSRDITFVGDTIIIARTFVYLIKPPPVY